MTRRMWIGMLFMVMVGWTSTEARAQGGAAAAAAKASPALISALAGEIGGSPEQAAGAAGALFGLAKSRLKPEEFGQISKAVQGWTCFSELPRRSAAAR